MHPLLSVQQESAGSERQPSGHKTHGSAGVAHEDRDFIRGDALAVSDANTIFERAGDIESDRADRLQRVTRVVGIEAIRDGRRAFRHRSQKQRANGVRLRRRSGDRGVDRSDLRNLLHFECRTQNAERRMKKGCLLNSSFCVLRSAFIGTPSEVRHRPTSRWPAALPRASRDRCHA